MSTGICAAKCPLLLTFFLLSVMFRIQISLANPTTERLSINGQKTTPFHKMGYFRSALTYFSRGIFFCLGFPAVESRRHSRDTAGRTGDKNAFSQGQYDGNYFFRGQGDEHLFHTGRRRIYDRRGLRRPHLHTDGPHTK